MVAFSRRLPSLAAMDQGISRVAAEANQPFGALVIESLRRFGVEHFVLSPGSRSTPLALAACSRVSGYSVILDERSAAFHALGRVKATGRPVALICTSGTAGAHYFPAVIEARESALPLVVLTADRPPELRHCHAGQTIDQLKLFGTYPLFHAELPLPEPDRLLMRQAREICRQAVEAALGDPSGPVHLNIPFREPFIPVETGSGNPDPALLEGLEPVRPAVMRGDAAAILPSRTLILAGPRPGRDDSRDLEAILRLSERLGFPILADGANPLRYGARGSAPPVIHYDRIARKDALWNALAPEALLLWGEPPTSKALRGRLEALDLPGYRIGGGKRAINPFNGRIAGPGIAPVDLASRVAGERDPAYAGKWREADTAAGRALEQALAEPHAFFEGDVHRILGDCLPEAAPLVFAGSLAVRDADWFMPRRDAALQPYSQRGANGIDGTVSLARGIAAGAQRPAWLVTGDLAFLHDGNGLLGSADDPHGLRVVLINNAGGGIFEFLPVARQHRGIFEQAFATPQNVSIERLVKAHNGGYSRAESPEALRAAMAAPAERGLHVIEVPVDRETSRELHRRFLELPDWD